jgi:hypothetical protein
MLSHRYHPPTPAKRDRTTPPTSDSDPEGYSRNNKPHEPPEPTPARIPQKTSPKARTSSSAEETTHNRSIVEMLSQTLEEYRPIPNSPRENTTTTAYRPVTRIRAWYQEQMGPRHPNAPHKRFKAIRTATTTPHVTDTRKDPAEPHPDDVPLPEKRTSPPPPLAEQRSLTTVTRLGGYTRQQHLPRSHHSRHRVQASSPSRRHTGKPTYPPGPSRTDPTATRPTTVQVNKPPAQIRPRTTPNPTLPPSIPTHPLPTPHRVPRPYIPAPRPHDVEGHPWCAGCTAQLSDDDITPPDSGIQTFPTPDTDCAWATKTNHQHILTFISI